MEGALAEFVQFQPGSTVQLAKQPLPVTPLVSHSSLAAASSRELLQNLAQVELAVPVQMKPSSAWQAEEHPSPLKLFLS